jgi:hypothetical protein
MDHKPLIFVLHRVSPPTSGRQQRHLAFISEYTNQLRYLPGTTKVVADALSRPAAAAAGAERVCAAIADKAPLDLKDMALRQILCPQVQALRSSPGLRIITQKVGDLDLLGDRWYPETSGVRFLNTSKCTATFRYPRSTSQCLHAVSATSTWIWWAPCQPPRVSPICLPSWTEHLAGLRQSHNITPQQ